MAAKSSNMAIRVIVLVLAAAGGIFFALQYKEQEKAAKGESLRAEVLRDLAGADLAASDRAYVESLVGMAHEEAYGRAFIAGEESTGGTVDVNLYQAELFERMIERARRDGSTHVAGALAAFGRERGIGEDGVG